MGEEQRRKFGRDGISGLVNRNRALRVRLVPRRGPKASKTEAQRDDEKGR